MFDFATDRRSLLRGGATLLAAAATMSSEQLLGYAKAWAQTAQWKPEACCAGSVSSKPRTSPS